ncbi:hypothetical protein VP01_170g2 [Puccinia sorghi]|uniref:Uncharacterized protein n=1 Tax=Puccinia sorghi TaxID=27349 RepID=A0A0L6VG50_9BASI|nr:hypothetical protein VP01_170g2 [Puccinia sorghi]
MLHYHLLITGFHPKNEYFKDTSTVAFIDPSTVIHLKAFLLRLTHILSGRNLISWHASIPGHNLYGPNCHIPSSLIYHPTTSSLASSMLMITIYSLHRVLLLPASTNAFDYLFCLYVCSFLLLCYLPNTPALDPKIIGYPGTIDANSCYYAKHLAHPEKSGHLKGDKNKKKKKTIKESLEGNWLALPERHGTPNTEIQREMKGETRNLARWNLIRTSQVTVILGHIVNSWVTTPTFLGFETPVRRHVHKKFNTILDTAVLIRGTSKQGGIFRRVVQKNHSTQLTTHSSTTLNLIPISFAKNIKSTPPCFFLFSFFPLGILYRSLFRLRNSMVKFIFPNKNYFNIICTTPGFRNAQFNRILLNLIESSEKELWKNLGKNFKTKIYLQSEKKNIHKARCSAKNLKIIFFWKIQLFQNLTCTPFAYQKLVPPPTQTCPPTSGGLNDQPFIFNSQCLKNYLSLSSLIFYMSSFIINCLSLYYFYHLRVSGSGMNNKSRSDYSTRIIHNFPSPLLKGGMIKDWVDLNGQVVSSVSNFSPPKPSSPYSPNNEALTSLFFNLAATFAATMAIKFPSRRTEFARTGQDVPFPICVQAATQVFKSSLLEMTKLSDCFKPLKQTIEAHHMMVLGQFLHKMIKIYCFGFVATGNLIKKGFGGLMIIQKIFFMLLGRILAKSLRYEADSRERLLYFVFVLVIAYFISLFFLEFYFLGLGSIGGFEITCRYGGGDGLVWTMGLITSCFIGEKAFLKESVDGWVVNAQKPRGIPCSYQAVSYYLTLEENPTNERQKLRLTHLLINFASGYLTALKWDGFHISFIINVINVGLVSFLLLVGFPVASPLTYRTHPSPHQVILFIYYFLSSSISPLWTSLGQMAEWSKALVLGEHHLGRCYVLEITSLRAWVQIPLCSLKTSHEAQVVKTSIYHGMNTQGVAQIATAATKAQALHHDPYQPGLFFVMSGSCYTRHSGCIHIPAEIYDRASLGNARGCFLRLSTTEKKPEKMLPSHSLPGRPYFLFYPQCRKLLIPRIKACCSFADFPGCHVPRLPCVYVVTGERYKKRSITLDRRCATYKSFYSRSTRHQLQLPFRVRSFNNFYETSLLFL